ncbi:MAG: SRPBCC domain-containing protein [Tumebacillaceae bacterium]
MSQENQQPALHVTHLFPGKRDRVFQAWTNKEELELWFGPEGYQTTVQELDVRAGGTYRFEMRNPDGGVAFLTGTYMEMIPSEKLVYTWRWMDWAANVEDTLVTVQFIDKGDSTEVSVTHQNFASETARAGHGFAWNGILEGRLRKYLAR